MADVAQLARVAAVTKPAQVLIVTLDRGFTIVEWLCNACVAEREAAGWTAVSKEDPPHPLRCQSCESPAVGDDCEAP